MVIIGSQAIRHHMGENTPHRFLRDSDRDVMAMPYESIPEGYDVIGGQGILDNYEFSGDYATIDEVYTLKVSHSFYPLHSWEKHIMDLTELSRHGATLIPELFDVACAQWSIRHGDKKVKLSMSKDDFFSCGVRRFFDHDSLHLATAIYDEPMFTRFLADGEEVLTDKNKFFAMSHADQVGAVSEEVGVLALERELLWLTEEPSLWDIRNAYVHQIKKLVTQYSSGWFPLFIIQNWADCCYPRHDFVGKFIESDCLLTGSYWDHRSDQWWVNTLHDHEQDE